MPRVNKKSASLCLDDDPGISEVKPDLEELFDQIAVIAKHSGTRRGQLPQLIKTLEKKIEQHDQEELSATIESWPELKVRLAQMKRASKRGNFDSHLEDSWRAMSLFLTSLPSKQRNEFENDPDYWKARTLIYELNDIFTRENTINQQVFADGPRVDDELRNLERNWHSNPKTLDPRQSAAFRVLIREKVLFCSCYGNELKRRGETEQGGRQLRWLLDFTERSLKTELWQCFGTRAALSYGLATIFRNLEHHRDARNYYTKALDLYFERATKRRADDHDDVLFTTRRIAMCIGLGFGWISLTRGYLRRAENALTTARAMLAQTPHSLVVDYIEFLYGNIKRCRAGSDKEQLKDAIASLELARAAFKEHGHGRYETRAARELALAFNLMGNYREALELAQFTEKNAIAEASLKGKVNACVLRSRILREQGKYAQALVEAERGLAMLVDHAEPLARVDALIACGECRLELAHNTRQKEVTYNDALRDFRTANEMLFIEDYDTGERQLRNPKIAAVCELRIAQCYARDGNQREAEDHFSIFRGLRTRVEHQWVRDLGRNVRGEIDKLTGNFVITKNDPARFDRDARLTELDKWIMQQALDETAGSVTRAAALIGLSRATLNRSRKGSHLKRLRVANNRNKS